MGMRLQKLMVKLSHTYHLLQILDLFARYESFRMIQVIFVTRNGV